MIYSYDTINFSALYSKIISVIVVSVSEYVKAASLSDGISLRESSNYCIIVAPPVFV